MSKLTNSDNYTVKEPAITNLRHSDLVVPPRPVSQFNFAKPLPTPPSRNDTDTKPLKLSSDSDARPVIIRTNPHGKAPSIPIPTKAPPPPPTKISLRQSGVITEAPSHPTSLSRTGSALSRGAPIATQFSYNEDKIIQVLVHYLGNEKAVTIGIKETDRVKDIIRNVVKKLSIPNAELLKFELNSPDYFGSEGFPLDNDELISFYSIQPEDTLTLKIKGPSVKIDSLNVVLNDGSIVSMATDLSLPANLLINKICKEYSYNSEDIVLYLDPDETEIIGNIVCKEQGIINGSVIKVKTNKKNHINNKNTKQGTTSTTAFKKKAGSMSGYIVTASSDHIATSNDQITFKKGDKITVLSEDVSGWWKGKCGDQLGIFHVSSVKYIEDDSKNNTNNLTKRTSSRTLPALSPSPSGFSIRNMFGGGKKKEETSSSNSSSSGASNNNNNNSGNNSSNSRSALTYNRQTNQIPKPLDDILTYLEQIHSYCEEGIFRVSGNIKDIYKLKELYEERRTVDLTKYDVHSIAGLLKLFLRELSEPLFTHELYDAFTTAIYIENEGMSLYCIREACSTLPAANKAIAKKLFGFLHKIIQHQDKSKMNPNNLAIVFAPSLFKPAKETYESMLSNDGKKLVEMIIVNYKLLFQTERESSSKLSPEFVEMLRRSSIQFENSQAEITMTNESDEISIEELAYTIIEGNKSAVDQYLDSLPDDIRKEKQLKIDLFIEETSRSM